MMPFNAEWITHKGTLTDDNRDYCAIALRKNNALYVVVDGSTKSDQSSALASTFARTLADRFKSEPGLDGPNEIAKYLHDLSAHFKALHPAGRLSFLILFDFSGTSVFTLHAGDCRLGRLGANSGITWLTRVHTLANALTDVGDGTLANDPNRHVLTRSFKPGKYCDVEISQHPLTNGDRLIIATDGYWADLNEEQKSAFIDKRFGPTASVQDDVSCLLLSSTPNTGDPLIKGEENFYYFKDQG